jgi:hypothetical protein
MKFKSIAEAYQEFNNSETFLKGNDLPVWFTDSYGDYENNGGLFYCDNQCYIVNGDDNKYLLEIENQSYESESLQELKNILFMDWVIPNQLIKLEV